jgi:glycosyltransferase involved in cell wall biosynthesis
MINLFINAVSASAGGGLTYVRNVVPHLAKREDVRTTLLLGDALHSEVQQSARVEIIRESWDGNSASRFWREQLQLAQMLRHAQADILLSPGNFALFRSPVPQILLSRNALYTSSDFLRDLRDRGDYRLFIDTKIKGAIARWSIAAADCTVAPSETFALALRHWTGKDVAFIHHGFDPCAFFRDTTPLSQDVQARLAFIAPPVKVLFVSHYNYYRNFETLIRAIAIAKQKLHPQPIRLILTCKLVSKENPGSYQADTAANLVRSLDLREEVIELGSVPYAQLHHLYKSCDMYATPAYAETFAHPLVEAMASGLPVIASDIPVHKEICGDAGLYFPRLLPEALAENIIQLHQSEKKKLTMREQGLSRVQEFRWSKHVNQLLELARSLAKPSVSQPNS